MLSRRAVVGASGVRSSRTQTHMIAVRHAFNIGGRKTPLGFSGEPSKHPQIKQGPSGGVVKRIPGTTKLEYTNKKGRTFTFSIPVAELTHPQVLRSSPSSTGWVNINTSFCDLGDLEDDMPSRVDELLPALIRHDGDSDDAADTAIPSVESLRELQRAFVEFCREYVLMDTQGMKTSLTYSELNNGPDYEMYDRKTMRKRYWLSIRHRFEDVQGILWPSIASGTPRLSPEEMLEALVWVEAASTFCVRKRHAYDMAAAEEFMPIDLHDAVCVLAEQARKNGWSFLDDAMSCGVRSVVKEMTDDEKKEAAQILSDRYTSCAALCLNHGVPFSSFFSTPSSPESAVDASGEFRCLATAAPPVSLPLDAIRVMSLLEAATGTRSGALYCFSDPVSGAVSDTELLAALARLCRPTVMGAGDALHNVDEGQLCTAMRFAVAIAEGNAALFACGAARPIAALNGEATAHVEVLRSFMRLAVSRCRFLLYRFGGPQTTVSSGDSEDVPIVQLQKIAERTNPQALVHHRIGMQNAQGLRFAMLRAKSSATLLELVDRLEAAGGGVGSLRTLASDLVQHIAQKVSMSKSQLSIQDAARVLPLLAKATQEDTGKAGTSGLTQRNERLLSAISSAVGAEVQRATDSEEVLMLLEGFAGCRYAPSSYTQLECVLLRLTIQRDFTVSHFTRALRAVLRLRGYTGVPRALLEQAASAAVAVGVSSDSLTLLRVMRYCHYEGLRPLVRHVLHDRSSVSDAIVAPDDQCAVGVLLACAAAVAHTEVEEEAAIAAECDTARTMLETGLRAMSAPTLDSRLMTDDLLADCVTACAALDVRAGDHGIATVVSRVSSARVHDLCTPLMAAGVLDSLETLDLASSTLHTAYAAYVERVLTTLMQHQMQCDSALLPDDAAVAVHVLRLSSAPDGVTRAAALVLKREVDRLDTQLSCGGARGNGEAPAASFEQGFLRNESARAQSEEALLEYCAAIQSNALAACVVGDLASAIL